MKKIGIVAITSLLLYIIYFDLTIGTLPANAKPILHKNAETEKTHSLTYQKHLVKPGETVISIAEQLHKGSLKVPIEQLINDFEELNPNVGVTKIQPGKTYFIPYYPKDGRR